MPATGGCDNEHRNHPDLGDRNVGGIRKASTLRSPIPIMTNIIFGVGSKKCAGKISRTFDNDENYG